MDLTVIDRMFHTIETEYIFFSSAHGKIFWIEHMISHKTNFSKFKIEIITTTFYDLSDAKLEIKNKRKVRSTNM